MEKKIHTPEAAHRDSRLRGIQGIVAPYIPGMLGFCDCLGAFPVDTKIHTARAEGRPIHADDITLTQLQMTAHICDNISQRRVYPGFDTTYILTSLLNGADGPVARSMGTVSKEGGIKDASVDRLSEIMITRLIGQELGFADEHIHELQVAFQLSTLTKAACEMSSTKTSEGGLGSMIERRKTLFFIMKDLINMHKIPQSFDSVRNSFVTRIEKRLANLVKGSNERALDRAVAIAQKTHKVHVPSDSDSTGADEARKYTGIVEMNRRMGIDIVQELNTLTEGIVTFPSLEELQEKEYIRETLVKADPFLTEALQIAGY